MLDNYHISLSASVLDVLLCSVLLFVIHTLSLSSLFYFFTWSVLTVCLRVFGWLPSLQSQVGSS